MSSESRSGRSGPTASPTWLPPAENDERPECEEHPPEAAGQVPVDVPRHQRCDRRRDRERDDDGYRHPLDADCTLDDARERPCCPARAQVREVDDREDRTHQSRECGDAVPFGNVPAWEHARDRVRESATDERRQHPDRPDLLVLRPDGRAAECEPDADDRTGDGERRRYRIAGPDADRHQRRTDRQHDDDARRRQPYAADEAAADGFGHVRALDDRASEPEDTDDERRTHRRDGVRADGRCEGGRAAGASTDDPRHEQTGEPCDDEETDN